MLSPSTEAYDRGRKFARYQRIKSFTDYVLIPQDEPRVEHYVKQSNGTWVLTVATGLRSKISIATIDCVLKLSEIYDRIEFDKEQTITINAQTLKLKKTNKKRVNK